MSQKPSLPNSAHRPVRPLPEPTPAADNTAKIVGGIAIVAAVVIAYLLKDYPRASAGFTLVATVTAFGLLFLFSRDSGESRETAPDAAGELAATLAANRTEYARQIADLRKALDAHKTDNAARKENEAIRQEIGKLRGELAGLRGALPKR